MIRIIKPDYIDCTANNYDSSKPALPKIVYKYDFNDKRPIIMSRSQANIWALLKARNFEEIERTKHYGYISGNHKHVEDIEQWILEYYDVLEECKDLTNLK